MNAGTLQSLELLAETKYFGVGPLSGRGETAASPPAWPGLLPSGPGPLHEL